MKNQNKNLSYILGGIALVAIVGLTVFGQSQSEDFQGRLRLPSPKKTPTATQCTSYTYSAWSTCTNGTQSRTVTSSSPTGCTGGVAPVLTQSCVMPAPAPTPAPANPPTITNILSGTVGNLNNGAMTLYKWTVKANGSGDTAIKQFAFHVNSTNGTLNGFKLYRNGTEISSFSSDIDIISDAGSNIEPLGSSITSSKILIQWNDATGAGEEIIMGGTMNTYELKATASGVTVGQVDTTLLGDSGNYKGSLTAGTSEVNVSGVSSNFVWSDFSSGSSHSSKVSGPSSTDWMDGKPVSGLGDPHSLIK